MTSMEFWGVEVKPGQSLPCDVGKEFIIHLSQAALGETEKESGNTVVSAKVGGNKVVIGTLSAENQPQIQFDLVFEKEFELSHSSETASVFVCGYKLAMPHLPEDGKKRVAETALKTPASDKKAKVATPACQTTGDDKNVPHVATPTKEASKASGNSNGKPKAKSPKSVGTHACKSCSRTFGSDFALQSHEKAKHT
ncbi:histone deacetylase HDT2-like [Lolium perenne]|uniref:histone deacetylase HDT2-like n=1 Tax=Lolium perenne TaxID=4522 RepID=UPI003A9904B7